jgi:hypothetical protein
VAAPRRRRRAPSPLLEDLEERIPRVGIRKPDWHWAYSPVEFAPEQNCWLDTRCNHLIPGPPVHPGHLDAAMGLCGVHLTFAPGPEDKLAPYCGVCLARRGEGVFRPTSWDHLDSELV